MVGDSGGIAWSRVSPMSCEAGTKRRPRARTWSIRIGSAATVCERSPPASCSRIVLPLAPGVG